ncbi:hypothetical protein EDB85DRAFT_1888046 [Lactarius pseudohatsudake]|nr:hypothetical protein EDB85DRAFT_1888046 [Lactarius pseudohatsudake]
MLPLTLLRTLNGPIPTLFTGDPTHAVQFIEDLARLVWTNPDHPLVSTPWMRIDTALAFISGPATLTWRRSIRCGRSTETATDALWDDFVESFCETWVVYPPESTVSVVAPAVQISTANVPSPSLAEASTLKRVENISIILATDELSPRCLSETIDPTADDDEADDWTLFAPRTSAPPPRNPLHPFSPRLASPMASILELVKPIDEQPRPPRSTCRSDSPTDPATTRNKSSDSPLPLTMTPDPSATASAVQRAEESPVTSPIKVEDGETFITSPQASDETRTKRKRGANGKVDTRSSKRVRTQTARRSVQLPRKIRYVHQPTTLPPPVDDSSGLFTPARSRPSPPSVQLTTPRRTILHDDISLQLPSQSPPDTIDPTADVECNTTDLAFSTSLPSPHFLSPPRLLSRPVSPPILSSPGVGMNDNGLKREASTSDLALYLRSPTEIRPSLALGNPLPTSPSNVIDLTLAAVNDAANAILSASSPPSPSPDPAPLTGHPPFLPDVASVTNVCNITGITHFTFPPLALCPRSYAELSPTPRLLLRRPSSPHTTSPSFAPALPFTSIVEDDNLSKGGVKTIDKLGFKTTSPPIPPYFPRHALEMPRDPDKIVPATRSRVSDVRPGPSNAPVDIRSTRDKDRHDTRNHERLPDTLTRRRAVEAFLKRYDATTATQEPIPAKTDRAYDAVAQHLDRWLRMTDRHYQSHPFHLHHAALQPTPIKPQQKLQNKRRHTKTNDAKPPQQSRSPGQVRKKPNATCTHT